MASRKFDLNVVCNAFGQCRVEIENEVTLDEYIKGYGELCRFLDMLGTVFTFVTSDVRSKMHILEEHRSSSVGDSYKTVQSMLQYEKDNDITIVKNKHANPSGARTLLRLHRALIFIIRLFEKIIDVNKEERLTGVAHEAYAETLSKHHPWLIRKAVNMAMYTLPTAQHMLDKMGAKEGQDQMLALIKKTVDAGHPVYDNIQAAYEKHKLLDLP